MKREDMIYRHFEDTKSARMPWESSWQRIAENLLPWRENEMYRREVSSELPGAAIYDGSALNAYKTFVDGMYGHICSRASKWFDLVGGTKEIDNSRDAKMWLDHATLGTFRRFNNSAFYNHISSFIGDCAGFGISHMMIEDVPAYKTVAYRPISPIRVYIAEDEFGEIGLYMIETNLSNHQAIQKFGKDNIPEEWAREYDRLPFERHEYLHIIGAKKGFEDIYEPKSKKPYFSIYIPVNHKPLIISEGGYDEMPVVTWRYSHNEASAYCYGPAHDAIYDILALHQMSKTLLQTAQMAATPPIAAPTELKKRLKMKPWGVTWVDDVNRIPQQWYRAGDYPIGKDYKDERRMIIEKHFLVDFFQLLQQLTARMTAFEVSERLAEKVAIIGPRVGQFTQQGLRTIIEHTIKIEIDNGRIAPPPDIITGGDNLVDVDFLGSLAQAQKKLAQGQGLQRAIQEAMPIFQMQQGTMDNIEWDEIVPLIFEINGAPSIAIKDTKKRDQERAQRMAMMQQQQQMQQLEQMGNAAKGLNQPEAENSLLEAIGEEAAG